ncbi:MAG: hypothetical protein AAF556_04640, partial [Pseudomonadota bacterium]
TEFTVETSGSETIYGFTLLGGPTTTITFTTTLVTTGTGGPFPDLLSFPGATLEYIIGGPGQDTVYGGGNDDVLFGDNETASSNNFADLLYGEADDDSLYGGGGDDVLYGGSGSDLISGGFLASDGETGTGDDVLFGGGTGLSGADTLYGGDGNDFLDGITNDGPGFTDYLYGGTGDDTIFAGDGDEVYGGQGNDQITINPNLFYGGVVASDGDDTVTLDQSGPNLSLTSDDIDGGSDEDVLVLLDDGVDFNFSGSSENINSTHFANFERIELGQLGDTGSGSITLNIQDVIDMTDSSNELELVLHSENGTLNLDNNFIDTGIDEVSDDGFTFSKYVDSLTATNTTLFVANDTGATISMTSVSVV